MNAGDHDHPALFEPTEEEIEEQERRDAEEYRAHEDRLDAEAEAERLQMEERDNEISAQIYGASEEERNAEFERSLERASAQRTLAQSGCMMPNCEYYNPHAGAYTFCETHTPKTSEEWDDLHAADYENIQEP